MKNQQNIVPLLGGINELQPQNPTHLSELTNWRTDDLTGGWSSKLGYEKFFVYASSFAPFGTTYPPSSFFIFKKHQGAQNLYLLEQGGKLQYIDEFSSTAALVTISEDRAKTKPTQARTQYMVVGRFVLIVNGYDKPLKYVGWPLVTASVANQPVLELGFWRLPGTPSAYNVEVSERAKASAGQKASVFWGLNNQKGLGSFKADDVNNYKWKVSFINSAGGESPLSAESNTVIWTSPSPSESWLDTYRFAIPIEIPVGDRGTVARRLYRTKNFSADGGANGDEFYYVTDIPNNIEDLFFDDIPDTSLGSLAPSPTDSILFPAHSCRFLGLFQDCLFIDGGASNDGQIFYSKPSKPDQFEALNFITVANRIGGGITGFFGYFNFLLIFRETAIDLVTGSYPNFVAQPFQQHIGTTAIDTVTAVPGLGIIFLSSDGVYSIGGNPQYSDTTNVTKISAPIQDTIARINTTCLASATAVYSEKWREWHCYVAVDGSDTPTLGLVYHTDKKAWSLREGFPVGCIDKNTQGELVFGSTDPYSTDVYEPHGVMVISKTRRLGQYKSAEATLSDNPPPTSIMASAWLNMGDPSLKKKVHGVYLFIRTGGDTSVALTIYKDYDYINSETTSAVKLQRADFTDQNVYDLVLLDNDKYWEEPIITPIRYDVHNGSCSWFQWKISTTKDIVVVGYAVDYTVSGTRIIAGKKV